MDKSKNLYRKFEYYAALFTIALLLFRFLFGTALNGLLITALVLMAIFYMWFGFFIFTGASVRELATPKSRSKFTPFMLASSIVMGLIYSLCTIAIIYGVYFYQGMNFMLGLAFILVFFATAVIIFYRWFSHDHTSYLKQYFRRSAVLGLFCLFMWLTPVNTRLHILFRHHPDFIEAYKNHRANPDDPLAEEQLKNVRSHFR